MPNHKSPRARLRSDARKRARNREAKSRMRTAIKKLRACSEPDEAATLLKTAVSAIDTATAKGAVHPGTADRQKSRLFSYVRTLTEEHH